MIVAALLACGSGPRVAPALPPAAADGAAVAPTPEPPPPPLPQLVALKRPAFKFGGGITAVALPADLPAEVEVSAIPVADVPPAVARTVPTRDGRRRLSTIEHPTWKAYPIPAGRTDNDPFDIVILFPAVPGAARVEASTATELPANLVAATISAAIDRDGDAKADLVFTDWCCGDHTSPITRACATPCGELWSLESGAWVMRERAGSNGAVVP